jgi:alpha-glucosidase
MGDFPWWHEGIIYQIYPRSFADSNGDGLGDLPGIISHLDYLTELGIDAIWLSPIYPSPDIDFGYDVIDHCMVDPRFGTLADFDRLVEETHRRGIRLILDMVMNHTSDQHPWFKESRSSRANPKRDWYIWRETPNNWQAWFGGKAWEYDGISSQYYLHLFAKEQPDLNWRNPEVRQALLDTFRFWMEHGVDGFRLDVFNAYFKHPDLPDNPPSFGLRSFDGQKHIHDMDQPEMMPFLTELRELLNTYPERYAVGETHLPTPQKAVSYCGPDKLHAAFSLDFTTFNSILAAAFQTYPWNPAWILKKILSREEAFTQAGIWPTTVMSNHDLPRAAGRYTKGEDDSQARIAMTLLLTLRGTPFIYYGEEIGMRDIHLRRNEILDPPGKRYWPIYKGRDGFRTPMQWNDGDHGGFSAARPWLPINPDFIDRNVATQRANPDSLFNFTKQLLALRKKTSALRHGEFVALDSGPNILAYLRTTNEEVVLVAINFNKHAETLTVPPGEWSALYTRSGDPAKTKAQLGPYEVRILIRSDQR